LDNLKTEVQFKHLDYRKKFRLQANIRQRSQTRQPRISDLSTHLMAERAKQVQTLAHKHADARRQANVYFSSICLIIYIMLN
jgi:hypothetical protein